MTGGESEDESDYTQSNVAVDPSAFDWRGWTLVGVVVFAFFVVPATILYLPAAEDVIRTLGLTVRDAYLVLPLLPAFGLGAVAVWSAIRTRST